MNLLTFLYHLYVCDGKDALLVSMVTLIPVIVNLASNSQSITLWGGGRAGMRRTTQKEEQEEERNDKKEVVKEKCLTKRLSLNPRKCGM